MQVPAPRSSHLLWGEEVSQWHCSVFWWRWGVLFSPLPGVQVRNHNSFPFWSQLLFRYSLPQCLTHFSSIVCACTLEPGVSRTTGWVVSTKQMSELIFPPLKAFQQVLISEQPMALSPAWSGIFPLHPSVTRPLWQQLWLLPQWPPSCPWTRLTVLLPTETLGAWAPYQDAC